MQGRQLFIATLPDALVDNLVVAEEIRLHYEAVSTDVCKRITDPKSDLKALVLDLLLDKFRVRKTTVDNGGFFCDAYTKIGVLNEIEKIQPDKSVETRLRHALTNDNSVLFANTSIEAGLKAIIKGYPECNALASCIRRTVDPLARLVRHVIAHLDGKCKHNDRHLSCSCLKYTDEHVQPGSFTEWCLAEAQTNNFAFSLFVNASETRQEGRATAELLFRAMFAYSDENFSATKMENIAEKIPPPIIRRLMANYKDIFFRVKAERGNAKLDLEFYAKLYGVRNNISRDSVAVFHSRTSYLEDTFSALTFFLCFDPCYTAEEVWAFGKTMRKVFKVPEDYNNGLGELTFAESGLGPHGSKKLVLSTNVFMHFSLRAVVDVVSKEANLLMFSPIVRPRMASGHCVAFFTGLFNLDEDPRVDMKAEAKQGSVMHREFLCLQYRDGFAFPRDLQLPLPSYANLFYKTLIDECAAGSVNVDHFFLCLDRIRDHGGDLTQFPDIYIWSCSSERVAIDDEFLRRRLLDCHSEFQAALAQNPGLTMENLAANLSLAYAAYREKAGHVTPWVKRVLDAAKEQAVRSAASVYDEIRAEARATETMPAPRPKRAKKA